VAFFDPNPRQEVAHDSPPLLKSAGRKDVSNPVQGLKQVQGLLKTAGSGWAGGLPDPSQLGLQAGPLSLKID